MHTGVFHQIDLERDGKTISYLGLPFSVDRSPYYRATIPICVIRNGEGPSALLMAGAHGDEYEGELLLARLIHRLEPRRVRGRVIDRLLLALRIVEAPTLVDALAPAPPMRLLSLAHDSQSLYAARRGWFEPAKSLGESVRAGETAGWLHDLERLEDPEEELRFAEDGIVLSMRLPTPCEPGDCLVQVAEELRT